MPVILMPRRLAGSSYCEGDQRSRTTEAGWRVPKALSSHLTRKLSSSNRFIQERPPPDLYAMILKFIVCLPVLARCLPKRALESVAPQERFALFLGCLERETCPCDRAVYRFLGEYPQCNNTNTKLIGYHSASFNVCSRTLTSKSKPNSTRPNSESDPLVCKQC
jgi:hypothetical protein